MCLRAVYIYAEDQTPDYMRVLPAVAAPCSRRCPLTLQPNAFDPTCAQTISHIATVTPKRHVARSPRWVSTSKPHRPSPRRTSPSQTTCLSPQTTCLSPQFTGPSPHLSSHWPSILHPPTGLPPSTLSDDYKESYIQPFARVLRAYRHVPTVVIIEPDSLGNLVASVGSSDWKSSGGCSEQVAAAYRDGIGYAVRSLAEASPSTALYVDGGHGGWLGFEENAARFTAIIAELGIAPLIRGFSTNVANYQPLGDGVNICPAEAFAHTGVRDATPGAGGSFGGVAHYCEKAKYPGGSVRGGKGAGAAAVAAPACCSYDPCHLLSKYSGGASEMMYAQTLQRCAAAGADHTDMYARVDEAL